MKPIGLTPVLYVTTLEQSLAFYINVLGFSILYQREEEGFAYMKRENVELMLSEIGKGSTWVTGDLTPPLGIGVNFQMEVSDVDALYQNVLENEIKLFADIEVKWYRKDGHHVGNKQFLVQDPDGYLLRFFQDMKKRDDLL